MSRCRQVGFTPVSGGHTVLRVIDIDLYEGALVEDVEDMDGGDWARWMKAGRWEEHGVDAERKSVALRWRGPRWI